MVRELTASVTFLGSALSSPHTALRIFGPHNMSSLGLYKNPRLTRCPNIKHASMLSPPRTETRREGMADIGVNGGVKC